ncbi:DUF4238 domain-containing protein [Arthrobacter sp. I2-34]|uniref:DUF4238 domain-containing protein n=1 Tax=Arthrobacter hankyongi TaxID=2904801 RepID=A0ABS9L5C8_9MICC|nr:DUF4238 domain-containing protein [Arthrobacter hankyongi]MCG2621778.1 DUF4238 domain-containing protein [Arthrobacter hankyongi]
MAGKGNTAKLHHYVPQGYLRGFATEKGRVTAVPLDRSRKPFTSSVKNVAAQTHFHTLEELEEPDEFEKALSGVEGEALNVLGKFERNEFPLSEADRWAFSYYMALQSVRGPDTRKTMEHLRAQFLRLEIGAGGRKNVGSWIKKNLGFDSSPEQEELLWAEATQPGGPPISFSNLSHIQHMLDTAESLTPYLATRPWSLVRFQRRSLVTSDAPVSLIRNPQDEAWAGVGFMTALGIAFPLTRKIGLLMSDPTVMLEGLEPDNPRVQETRSAVLRGEFDRIQTGTTAMEKLFNEHSAHSAREYVFHHPEDEMFVPDELPEPNLINMRASGLVDADFDGKPWFGVSDTQETKHEESEHA